jgi:hypothetical protein
VEASRAAVLLGVLLAIGARADEPEPVRGVEVAFRTGILFPAGDVQTYTFPDPPEAGPDSISHWFKSQFPLWVDIGVRFDRWFVGAYGQYAFGVPAFCSGPAPSTCSAFAIRTGLEVQFHPASWKLVDPWVELGVGYEWDSWRRALDSGEVVVITFHGWEFLRLGVGLDFRLTEGLRLGPFIGFSLGRFQGLSSDMAKPALHQWFCLGLKLTH